MAWLYLFVAIIFEVAFAVSLKMAEGFTRLWPSVAAIIGVIGGIYFLGLALRELPVSVGYSAWTGLGIIGTVILSLVLFGESMSLLKAASIAAIVCGIVGLRLSMGDT